MLQVVNNNPKEFMDSLAVWLNKTGGESDVTMNALKSLCDTLGVKLGDVLVYQLNNNLEGFKAYFNQKWQDYTQLNQENRDFYGPKLDTLNARASVLIGGVANVSAEIANAEQRADANKDSIINAIKGFEASSNEKQDTIIANIKNQFSIILPELQEIKSSVDKGDSLLNVVAQNGNNALTVQQFIDASAHLDSINRTEMHNDLVTIFEAFGIDSINANVIKVGNITHEDFGRVIELMQLVVDSNDPESIRSYIKEIKNIVETRDFCDCDGVNQNNTESILDNLDNVFAQNVADRVNLTALKFLLNNKNNTKVLSYNGLYV